MWMELLVLQFYEFCKSEIAVDVTSTQEINFPNFQWQEIKDAPVTSL